MCPIEILQYYYPHFVHNLARGLFTDTGNQFVLGGGVPLFFGSLAHEPGFVESDHAAATVD